MERQGFYGKVFLPENLLPVEREKRRRTVENKWKTIDKQFYSWLTDYIVLFVVK